MRNVQKFCVYVTDFTLFDDAYCETRGYFRVFFPKYKKERLVCRSRLSVCDITSMTKQFIGFYQFGREVLEKKVINQT